MTKIVTISVSDADEPLIAELDKLGGSRSRRIVEAIRLYLGTHAIEADKPFWFVEGKDYSHLPIDTRKQLQKFGYTDAELEAEEKTDG